MKQEKRKQKNKRKEQNIDNNKTTKKKNWKRTIDHRECSKGNHFSLTKKKITTAMQEEFLFTSLICRWNKPMSRGVKNEKLFTFCHYQNKHRHLEFPSDLFLSKIVFMYLWIWGLSHDSVTKKRSSLVGEIDVVMVEFITYV